MQVEGSMPEQDLAAETSKATSKNSKFGIRLLDLPVEVLDNIMACSSTSALRAIGSACKLTRSIAAPFLFASINLDNLNPKKLSEAFSDLASWLHVRKLACRVTAPYDYSTSEATQRLTSKYIKLLLGLIGKRIKALQLNVDLSAYHRDEEDDDDPGVEAAETSEAVQELLDIADTYHLHLSYKHWHWNHDDEQEATWPTFHLPLLGGFGVDKVTRVKLEQFNSFYWGQNGDFTRPIQVENDLRTRLLSFINLRELTLEKCRLSQRMSTMALPGLTHLTLHFTPIGSDKEQDPDEEIDLETFDASACLSLITSSRETLIRLVLKGVDMEPEDIITLPCLLFLQMDDCGLFPFLEYAHMPKLSTMKILHSTVNLEGINSYFCNGDTLPSLKFFQLYACELEGEEDFANTYTMLKSSCQYRGVKLRLTHVNRVFDAWLDRDKVAALADNIKDIKITLSSHNEQRDYLHIIAPALCELDLSLSFTLQGDMGTGHLATGDILHFLERFHSPSLCELSINFSSPTVEYLLEFHKAINSGSFRAQFPYCKTIKGSITTDTESLWEAKHNRPKQISGWLKENILKACKEQRIDATGIVWKNARMVV